MKRFKKIYIDMLAINAKKKLFNYDIYFLHLDSLLFGHGDMLN